MKLHKQKAFAIMCLVRGRSWGFTCGEDSYYHISYDGFKLEQRMYELKGKHPNNLYKIVSIEIKETLK